MNDLLKKLQELGLNIDRGSNIEVEFKPKTNVDNIVEGEWFESNNQRIFYVRSFINRDTIMAASILHPNMI